MGEYLLCDDCIVVVNTVKYSRTLADENEVLYVLSQEFCSATGP